MADIQPFRGFRYNTSLLSSTEQADVVAPPYDVIDSYEQIALYERHPYNIVRLILNQEQTEDSPENNRYTRARRHLMDWFARGVLQHDEAPRFYVHEQTFKMEDGRQVTRRGFLGGCGLRPTKRISCCPTSERFAGPKKIAYA